MGHNFVRSFVRSFVHSFVRLFVRSFVRLYVRPHFKFVRSFVCTSPLQVCLFVCSYVRPLGVGDVSWKCYRKVDYPGFMK